jgi:hypothetical protein
VIVALVLLQSERVRSLVLRRRIGRARRCGAGDDI